MSDLLPYNATDAERAMANTIARISDVPVLVREVWNPDTAPASVLPWLAWAFSVDDWDANWTDAQKRNVIKQSVYSQRIKGTIGAVTRQLAALGYTIQILEWWQKDPVGAPYTFDVYITASQYPLTSSDYNKVLEVIDTNKNLRSHMGQVTVMAQSLSNVTCATVSALGAEISVTNYGYVPAAVNDFALMNNTIRV